MNKAVVLVNIGSPDDFNVASVRKYLKKFLGDGRVIDIPFIPRFLLVNGIIAPFRASKSLNAYKTILIENQSPLLYYSYLAEKKLQKLLGEAYIVKTAMMYGAPYLNDVLNTLKQKHLSEIIIIPLYPQYASSTTGSALEMFFNHIKNWQIIPNIKTIHTFYHHPQFIEIWANHIHKYLPNNYDFILFSYHGLPIRQIYKADAQFESRHCDMKGCCNCYTPQNHFCYRLNCIETTRLISEKLSLDKNKSGIAFQSRLGNAEWLKPYAADTLKDLADKGIKNLVVVSPAFVTDCLETLYEIKIEYSEMFKHFGGENLTLIPSLNDEDNWVKFLYSLIKQ